MPSNQETFDTVVNHLRDQGGPSMSSVNNVCALFAENGRKCAVGSLIPDQDIKDITDLGAGVENKEVAQVLRREGHSVELALALQKAHDGAAGRPGAWAQEIEPFLATVADMFGLAYAPMDHV